MIGPVVDMLVDSTGTPIVLSTPALAGTRFSHLTWFDPLTDTGHATRVTAPFRRIGLVRPPLMFGEHAAPWPGLTGPAAQTLRTSRSDGPR
jgi:hypothetical protein